MTAFSDDIQTLYQTAVRPHETETIWFQTAIGKPCTTVTLVLWKLHDATLSPKHKFVSLIEESWTRLVLEGAFCS